MSDASTPERLILAGYLGIQCEKVPETYNAGFSTYVSAWPLVKRYPGNQFQTGLFGTWMHPQYEQKPDRKLYCDIEGGLGWWRDTRFATETPKFIMGGVALNFCAWANGPGAGKNRDWDHPLGLYGVAQLSPYIIWPPDGLNLKQGTCGQFWGYGYLPLPLIKAKETTTGKPVPTGGNCWTLFLNTGNFKGPVAFFTPYFFSEPSVEDPEIAGMFLDTRPAIPNRPHQMETQYIPAAVSKSGDGTGYARIDVTSFPRNVDNISPVMHQITAYNRDALYNGVEAWLDGDGAPVEGAINRNGAVVHKVVRENRASWAIFTNGTKREDRTRIDWESIATGFAIDDHTFGYRWNEQWCKPIDTADGLLMALPEYYRLEKKDDDTELWIPIKPEEMPSDTGLQDVDFTPKVGQELEVQTSREFTPRASELMAPYVTPTDPSSCWKTPGPVAGPFKAFPGDGSTVVYSWYRFADQPALLNADLSDVEREELQKRVEKLHAEWKRDRDFLPPPAFGKLADIDPALVVTPPEGLEVGHVPIVTWQGME